MIASVIGICLTCAVIMMGVVMKKGMLMKNAEKRKAVITKVKRDKDNPNVWMYELEIKKDGKVYNVETHRCFSTKEYHVGDRIGVRFKIFSVLGKWDIPNVQVDEKEVKVDKKEIIEENNANTVIAAGFVLLAIELVILVAGMLN